jgi:RNA polymerase sigma-70 factor (sigma-E family)
LRVYEGELLFVVRAARKDDRIFVERLCVLIVMGHTSIDQANGVWVAQSSQGKLAELYAAHADSTKRLAFLLTGDSELAEDITQDAFVKIAGRIGGLRNRDASAAYLRQTVVNLSRSHFRRKRVERAYLEREASGPQSGSVGGRDFVEADALWNEIHRLPYRQRCAVVLRYYEDLSEHQTAEILNCSVGAAKALTNRAMEQLRANVGSEARS